MSKFVIYEYLSHSLIQNLGWTDLKKKRKNSRLLCKFNCILNELVEKNKEMNI